MNDYMVRGTAANAQLRVFAATTKETAERARLAHNTSPVMTAALGRLLTVGAMMGSMMKGEEDPGGRPGKGIDGNGGCQRECQRVCAGAAGDPACE